MLSTRIVNSSVPETIQSHPGLITASTLAAASIETLQGPDRCDHIDPPFQLDNAPNENLALLPESPRVHLGFGLNRNALLAHDFSIFRPQLLDTHSGHDRFARGPTSSAPARDRARATDEIPLCSVAENCWCLWLGSRPIPAVSAGTDGPGTVGLGFREETGRTTAGHALPTRPVRPLHRSLGGLPAPS